MRTIKILVLGLAVAAFFGVAAATSALASEPAWEHCMSLEGGGFESNTCTNEKESGGWEWKEVTGSDTVRLLGFSLYLKDTGIGTTAYCPDAGKGWGYIEKDKLITTVAESKEPEKEGCRVEGEFLTCKAGKLEKLEGIHLPWTSEVFETEEKLLSNIIGTSGRPGWRITCGGAADECEESTEKKEYTELQNGEINGVSLVPSRFENKNKGHCSIGGALKGEIKGLLAISEANGAGLLVGPTFSLETNKEGEPLANNGRATYTITQHRFNPAEKLKTPFKITEMPKGGGHWTEPTPAERTTCENMTYKIMDRTCSFVVEYKGTVESTYSVTIKPKKGGFGERTLEGN